MAYEFKKLADVEVSETASDFAYILMEDGGVVKRVPRDAVAPEVEVPEQINADWNENDETSPAYVVNRTHYAVPTVKEVVLMEGTDLKNGSLVDARWHDLEAGDPMKVVCDGVSYESEVWLNEYDQKCIGNLYNEGDTDVPCGFRSSGDVWFSDSETHSLKITYEQETEDIKTLDEKYLPASVTDMCSRAVVDNATNTERAVTSGILFWDHVNSNYYVLKVEGGEVVLSSL